MNNEIKTFVLLKYPMITSDQDTWHLCEKYPESVNKKWALRCARDVEHLDKAGRAKKCNDLNERYQNGETELLEELKKAADAALHASTPVDAAAAAYYANYAAYTASRANATYCAAYIATDREEKWKLYIQWLIEELCEYEEKQNE